MGDLLNEHGSSFILKGHAQSKFPFRNSWEACLAGNNIQKTRINPLYPSFSSRNYLNGSKWINLTIFEDWKSGCQSYSIKTQNGSYHFSYTTV